MIMKRMYTNNSYLNSQLRKVVPLLIDAFKNKIAKPVKAKEGSFRKKCRPCLKLLLIVIASVKL